MFEKLRRQVKLSGELKSLVHTMKGMATVGIAAAQQAAEGARQYQAIVEDGLGVLLRDRGWHLPSGSRTLAVVVGTDVGMCGAFNRNVAEYAAAALAPRGVCRLIVVGHRAAAQLRTLKWTPSLVVVTPGDVESLSATAYDLLVEMQGRDYDEVIAICQHTRTTATVAPRVVSLWPLSPERVEQIRQRPWSSRVRPSVWPPEAAEDVLEALLRQLLFANLYDVLAGSLAAELTARIMAMEAAEKAVEERQSALIAALARARQERITDELLDVISGFEVQQADQPLSAPPGADLRARPGD